MKKAFDNKQSWEYRYEDDSNLAAPGTFTHTHKGNINFYLTKFKALDRVSSFIGTSLKDKNVLEVAGGTGQFVDYYLQRGANKVVLTDFAENAVHKVNSRYAKDERVTAELYDLTIPKNDWNIAFDFIFLMEAIFLINSEESVKTAIYSLSNAVKPGGYLIISDVFPKKTILRDYVIRRSKGFFEETLFNEGFEVIGYVPQTFLFNRRVFGRFQRLIENNTGQLLYFLDQFALRLNLKPPQDTWAAVKYLVAKKIEIK